MFKGIIHIWRDQHAALNTRDRGDLCGLFLFVVCTEFNDNVNKMCKRVNEYAMDKQITAKVMVMYIVS